MRDALRVLEAAGRVEIRVGARGGLAWDAIARDRDTLRAWMDTTC